MLCVFFVDGWGVRAAGGSGSLLVVARASWEYSVDWEVSSGRTVAGVWLRDGAWTTAAHGWAMVAETPVLVEFCWSLPVLRHDGGYRAAWMSQFVVCPQSHLNHYCLWLEWLFWYSSNQSQKNKVRWRQYSKVWIGVDQDQVNGAGLAYPDLRY